MLEFFSITRDCRTLLFLKDGLMGTSSAPQYLVFAEDECRGDGSDTWRRVWWKSKLSKEEIRRLTSKSYIDEEGWIKNQAFNMLS
ncbi:putative pectin lyase [Helianthus annuus]|nr:putative pectin lyase [Helianthus annuus]KAJ0717849.1 putative pectin lyase [Helianthus annuus]